MKKVIITVGAYGYMPDKNGPVISIDYKYGKPISLSDEEADRIVGLGIAKYADTKDVGENEGNIDPDDLSTYAYNDLKKLAKEMGLSAAGSKEELIKRISDEKVVIPSDAEVDETENDDNEEPPVLEAAEPEV